MGREAWNLSKNVYSLGAPLSSRSCSVVLCAAEGSYLKKAGRPAERKTQEVQPVDSAVGFELSEATWPGTEGRPCRSG